MKSPPRRLFWLPRTPLGITAAYLAFGIAWILLTDGLLLWLERSGPAFAGWQNAKGLLFVGGTALVLYLLLRHAQRATTKVQQARQQSDRALTGLVEAAPLSILLVDAEGCITYANARSAEAFGYAPESLLGLPIEQLVPEQHRALHWEQHANFMNSPHIRPLDEIPNLAARRGDGSVFPAEIALCPLTLDGEMRIACFVRDITRRVQIEAEVKSLAKFPAENPNPVLRLGHDGRVRYANAASQPLLAAWGCAVGETAPLFWRELVAGALADQAVKELDVLYSGRVWVISVTPVAGEDYVNLYGRDVTDRRRAEDALRASEEQYRSLVEHASDGIFVFDGQGQFVDVNSSACALLGYSRDELLALGISDVNAPDDLAAQPVNWDALLAGQSVRSERAVVRKDGAQLPVEVSSKLLPGGHVLSITRDISERKQAEAQARKLYRTLAVLSDVNQAIVRIRSIPALLEKACAIATEQGGFRMAWIGLLDPPGGPVMRLAAQSGVPADYLEGLLYIMETQPFEQHPGYNLLSAGQPAVNQDAEAGQHPHIVARRQAARQAGYRSSIALPLVVAGDLRGVFALYAREPGFFDAEELRLLEEMAMDVGFAIEFAEQAARRAAAEERFARAFHTNPLAASITTLDEGRFIEANDRYVQLMGFESHTQLLGRTLAETGIGLDLDSRRAYAERLMGGEDVGAVELPFHTRSGETRLARYSAVRMDIRGVPCLLATLEDITEEKQATVARQEQQALAEALRDTVAALTSTLDPEEVMQRILENAGRVVPHEAANIMLVEGEVARVKYWRGYPPDHAEALRAIRVPLGWPGIQAMLTSGEPYLAADSQIDPRWVFVKESEWVRSHISMPIRSRQQIIGFLNLDSETADYFNEAHVARLRAFADYAAVALENAQLYEELHSHAAELEWHVRQRTAELETQRAQLQAILEGMGEGVLYIEGGVVGYANSALGDLLGYSIEEIHQSSHQVHDAVLQAVMDIIEASTLAGENWRGELKLQRRDGSTFDAALIISPVPLPGAPIPGHVMLIRDISQDKALQAQKDRFIAQASHELRTPVTTMTLRLYLLRNQPELADKHLEMLEQEVTRMTQLVEDLLNVSRFERGIVELNPRLMDLNTLVTEVVESQRIRAEAKGLALEAELLPATLPIHADPDRLHQVLTNLVVNAINYTPAGGKVWVRVQRPGQDHQLYIQVVDTGIGVAPEMLPRLFEPFFREQRVKTPGTGLGLNISRHIMELHGGGIEVHSVKDGGSTFAMRLPIK